MLFVVLLYGVKWYVCCGLFVVLWLCVVRCSFFVVGCGCGLLRLLLSVDERLRLLVFVLCGCLLCGLCDCCLLIVVCCVLCVACCCSARCS